MWLLKEILVLLGVDLCKFNWCMGGYIKDKNLICPKCHRSISYYKLTNRIQQELMVLLKKEELEDFCLWAFGEQSRYLTAEVCVTHWNAHHGDALRIFPNHVISLTAPKMIELWKKNV